jgi:DNA-binding response OmpR family regulator
MSDRLLVVEDDPAVLQMISQIMTLEGFVVSAVTDGAGALDALRGGDFAAVVLDVMLPSKDGIAIMKEIREQPGLGGLPVVMLTARADDDTTWAGWRAGCNYYMTKPFDPTELSALVRRLVSAQEAS